MSRKQMEKCGSKKQLNENDARYKAAQSTQYSGTHWSAYHCEYCGCWHIGHTPSDILLGLTGKDAENRRKGNSSVEVQSAG